MFSRTIGDNAELHLLEEHHAEQVFAKVQLDRDELRQWLPWVEGCRSVEDVRTFIRQSLEDFGRKNGFSAGIFLEGKVVGVIGLHAIDWSNRCSSIGYWLGGSAQGRGLMTAACRALLDHAFGDLQLHRIEIHCAPENPKSYAIPERLGFRKEGVLREEEFINGRFLDSVVYGMLDREWEMRSPPKQHAPPVPSPSGRGIG